MSGVRALACGLGLLAAVSACDPADAPATTEETALVAPEQQRAVEASLADLLPEIGDSVGLTGVRSSGYFTGCLVDDKYVARITLFGFAYGSDPAATTQTEALRAAFERAGLAVEVDADGELVAHPAGVLVVASPPVARRPTGTPAGPTFRTLQVESGCAPHGPADRAYVEQAQATDYRDLVPLRP